MSDAERKLLLALADLIRHDPNLCERFMQTLPRDHEAHETWGTAADKGWILIGDMMKAVEAKLR